MVWPIYVNKQSRAGIEKNCIATSPVETHLCLCFQDSDELWICTLLEGLLLCLLCGCGCSMHTLHLAVCCRCICRSSHHVTSHILRRWIEGLLSGTFEQSHCMLGWVLKWRILPNVRKHNLLYTIQTLFHSFNDASFVHIKKISWHQRARRKSEERRS